MSWDGRLDVEILDSPNNWEIGFVIKHSEQKKLTAQMIIDAIGDVVMQIYGDIPVRTFGDLDA